MPFLLRLRFSTRQLVTVALGLVAAGALGLGILQSAGAAPPFSAVARIDPRVQYLGDAGTTFTVTVRNTGSTDSIGSVELDRPSTSWKITACPAAPEGWTAQRAATMCRYRSGRGTADDIAPGAASSAFQVRAAVRHGSRNIAATWRVKVSRSDRFDKPSKLAAAAIRPPGLGITAYSFQVLDAVLDPSTTTPGAACPSPSKSARPGSTGHTLVICGRNRTTRTLTPTAARASLSGSFLAGHGSFASGRVAPTTSSRVLGVWSNVTLTSVPGPDKTVRAGIGSARNRTSPRTTLTGYDVRNNPPVAVDDAASTDQDTSVPVNVLANDSEPDGDAISVTATSTTGTAGRVTITGGGKSLRYDPDGRFDYLAAGQSATDTFTYTASDPFGASAVAKVTMTVTGSDDAPVAVGDSATVGEDSSATTIAVLTNDTDVDGGLLMVASVTQPAHGTAAVTGAGTGVSYAPDASYCNTPPGVSHDTFTYTLNGGSTATVSMTVSCAADPPVVDTSAGATSYTENDPATPIDPGVTVTDPDAGATIMSATVAITSNFATGQDVLALAGSHPGITAQPQAGNTLSLTGTASLAAYQAALREVTYLNTSEGPSTLTRTVTFMVTDDTGLTDSDTKAVTVTGANDSPIAVNDTGTTDEDTTLTVAAPGVLANDIDLDPGDTKTVVALNGTGTLTQTLSSGASVTIGANGSYSYNPQGAFQSLSTGQTASDSFAYTMQDGAGAQSTATVNLTINGVSDAPTAVADTFDVIGNTGLFVGTTKPGTQAGKEISGSVLANDTDPDTPQGSLVAQPVTNAPTTLGGTITIASDGSFTFQPDDGDTGMTDTFTYRVCDASPCNAGTVANATGTLSLPIAGQVWYVKNSQPGGGDGTSDTPFDTLAAAEAASGPGDTVYVFEGDGSSTKLDTGYAMEAGERLIGESRPLALDPDGGGPAPMASLFAGTSGAEPTLTATNEDVIVLAGNVVVDGLDVDPSGLGGGISGAAVGDVTVSHVNVIDTGTAGTQPGIDLDSTTGTNRFSDVTVTNGGSATAVGVRLNNAGVVAFASTGTNTISTTGAKALDAAGTNLSTSRWSDITVSGSGSGAIRLSADTGSPTLGDGAGTDLSLQTTSGTTPALDIASSNGVTVDAAGTDTISATGGPAVDIRNSNGSSFTFDSVSSTNSAGDGINLDTNLTTPFTATTGAISGAAGIAVDVNAGGTAGGVNYGGAINDGPGSSAEITGRDGGSVTLSGSIGDGADAGGGITVSGNTGGAVTFSGASKVLNTGASTAVSFTSNSGGSSLSFTGGGALHITATSGKGIDAAGNVGSLDVQGSGNTIDTTTGTALNVVNTPLGATGLMFQRISASGAVNGIVLDSTGTAGGLTVTGTGAAGSGGTIQNTTSDSLVLTTTRDVSLTSMNVLNSQESGILGSGVTNLNLASSSFLNNGNDSGDVGIKVSNLLGTSTWNALSVTGSALTNVFIDNTSGTLNALKVTGASHFDSVGTTFGANSVLIEMRGTAVMNGGSITGATFNNNKPARGITVQAQDAASIGDASTNAFVVQDSTFTNNGLQASFEQSGTANLTFKLLDNGTAAAPMTMPNTTVGTSHAVNVFSSSTSTSGTVRGRIAGNFIGNGGVAGSGSPGGNGIRALIQGKTVATLLIDSNTIRQTPQARGIDVQLLGPVDASGVSSPQDITVTNNNVFPQDSTGFPASAIYVAADSQGGGPVTTRTDIRGNTVPAGSAFDSLPTFLALDKPVASSLCQLVDPTPGSINATAQLVSANTGSASAAATCTLISGPISTPP